MARLTTAAYIAYLKDLAKRHVDIQHTEEEKHFGRVKLTQAIIPFQKDSLEEFVTDQNKKMHFPYMVAFYPTTGFKDNLSDNKTQVLEGAFALLDIRSKGDFEGEEAIYTSMETIAWEMVAEIKRDYQSLQKRAAQSFHVDKVIIQPIGPINGNLFGVRVDFQLPHSCNDDFIVDESKWIGN